MTTRKLLILTTRGLPGWRQHKEALPKCDWLNVVTEHAETLKSLDELLSKHRPDWVIMPLFRKLGDVHLRSYIEHGVSLLIVPDNCDNLDEKFLRSARISVQTFCHDTDFELFLEHCRRM